MPAVAATKPKRKQKPKGQEYVALRGMDVGGGRSVVAGDPLPEAAGWRNLKAYLQTGRVCKKGEEPAWLKTRKPMPSGNAAVKAERKALAEGKKAKGAKKKAKKKKAKKKAKKKVAKKSEPKKAEGG